MKQIDPEELVDYAKVRQLHLVRSLRQSRQIEPRLVWFGDLAVSDYARDLELDLVAGLRSELKAGERILAVGQIGEIKFEYAAVDWLLRAWEAIKSAHNLEGASVTWLAEDQLVRELEEAGVALGDSGRVVIELRPDKQGITQAEVLVGVEIWLLALSLIVDHLLGQGFNQA